MLRLLPPALCIASSGTMPGGVPGKLFSYPADETPEGYEFPIRKYLDCCEYVSAGLDEDVPPQCTQFVTPNSEASPELAVRSSELKFICRNQARLLVYLFSTQVEGT
jgi:hypothetical protein